LFILKSYILDLVRSYHSLNCEIRDFYFVAFDLRRNQRFRLGHITVSIAKSEISISLRLTYDEIRDFG